MRTLQNSSSKVGAFYEDGVDNILYHYNSISKLCGLSEAEKGLTTPIILKDNAFQYFNSYSKHCHNFGDAVIFLRKRYDSSDKRSRILFEWQTMKLGSYFSQHPTMSEADAFLLLPQDYAFKEPV